WSINWDEFYNFEFSNNHRTYLDGLGAASARNLDHANQLTDELPEENMDAVLFYPNPFNNEVSLTFTLREEQKVSLSVYNQMGAKVVDLVQDNSLSLGSHKITWNSEQMPSGLYLFRLGIGNEATTYRIVKQ
ncbi:MAG: T9SS type A sorting domain-containing protein, partial [Reichenbachiella sp.]